jgi:hypothetical protein
LTERHVSRGFSRWFFSKYFAESRDPQKSGRKLHTKRVNEVQRRISFIVVCLLGVLGTRVSAQSGVSMDGRNFLPIQPPVYPENRVFLQVSESHAVGAAFALRQLLQHGPADLYLLPRILDDDFYCRQLGFFCRKEWEFEKKTNIPLRFRLGSLSDCNFMEGKTSLRQ